MILEPIVRGIPTVSVVQVNRADQRLSWATWTEYGPHDTQAPTSHLALVRTVGRSSTVLWSERYPDAYEPRIELLYGDLPSGVTAVLLRDQLGAAAARATLYALDRTDVVRRIGSVEGGIIDVLTYADNTLRVSSGRQDPPVCYGWRRSDDTLATRPCP